MMATVRKLFHSWEESEMEKKTVIQLAQVLKILVTAAFVVNLAVLTLVPGLVGMRGLAGLTQAAGQTELPPALLFLAACWQYIPRVWREGQYQVMLTLFLLACGVCTAVILWQGRRVLNTILKGNPFCMDNAKSLCRAAVCCFLIAAFALVRVAWSVWHFGSVMPLLTYNALFIPIFLMAGLLCLVMSALFRQAAEMKAEQDLTI